MHLLFALFLSFLCTYLFAYSFHRLPCSWLFDEAAFSPKTYHSPHPYADHLMLIPHLLALFVVFFVVCFDLSEKVALMDVLGGLCLFWFLIQIALLDFLYRSIPDQWSFSIMILGILHLLEATFSSGLHGFFLFVQDRILSLLLWFAIFLVLSIIPRAFHKTSMMGLGDIKLLLALAIVLPNGLYLTLLIHTAFIGGFIAILLILRKQTDQGVPFGTALALGMFFKFLCI